MDEQERINYNLKNARRVEMLAYEIALEANSDISEDADEEFVALCTYILSEKLPGFYDENRESWIKKMAEDWEKDRAEWMEDGLAYLG